MTCHSGSLGAGLLGFGAIDVKHALSEAICCVTVDVKHDVRCLKPVVLAPRPAPMASNMMCVV